MNDYSKNAKKLKFSQYRFQYLNTIIKFLQKHGKVYLVRLPQMKEMKEIENKLMPDFDNRIQILTKENGVNYFNFIESGDLYKYTDGNHLHKNSGKIVSQQIADSIMHFTFSK